MERKIKVSDIEAAVGRAYETFKSDKDGTPCPVCSDGNAGKFAISVALPDGTLIHKGDTDTLAPLGALANIPVHIQLLQQMDVDQLVKKSGRGSLEESRKKKDCKCDDQQPSDKQKMAHLHLGKHGIRAVSAVEPTGDPDGKMDILTDIINNVMGSAPVLDDKIYEEKKQMASESNLVNKLAERGYYLYDDAAQSVDIYARLTSLKATTDQVATMGATIVADGYCAPTAQHVFDGKISKSIIALIATMSKRHINTPWMMLTGIPAMFTRGGFVLAVVPGVMAIAAMAPELNDAKVSEKAMNAVKEIATDLDLSIYNSSRVSVDK